jgi:imidazolonepropionase
VSPDPAGSRRARTRQETGMSPDPADGRMGAESAGPRRPDSMVVTGIAELVTNDPSVGDGSPLGLLRDAAVVVEDGWVVWVGPAGAAPAADRRVDVGGRAVIPGFVDSHAHLVFAGDRSAEFAARMAGASYDGGGIAFTVAATAEASDEQLRSLLAGRMAEMRAQGTTTVEIKSGYGLTVAGEVRALRLAGEVTGETTFLGAHVVPAGTWRDEYLRLVTGEMLDVCAPLARWIDVFCEPGSPHAFDGEEARAVLSAGAAAGLGLRVHGNQLAPGPGVSLAVELRAASVDHCTHLSGADVDALAGGATVATLLPGVEWSTRSPYPDARRLLTAGVTVALATDCNPGTCASSSMPLMIALAVREMGMTPAEALWAATAGGAAALRRDDIGVLAPGRRADLAVVDGPSHVHLAYRPGGPIARTLEVSGT